MFGQLLIQPTTGVFLFPFQGGDRNELSALLLDRVLEYLSLLSIPVIGRLVIPFHRLENWLRAGHHMANNWSWIGT